MCEFDTSIVGSEPPVDGVWLIIAVDFPCGHLVSHLGDFGDATVEALALEGAEFDFGNIEPTAMFGCVMDFKTLSQSPGLWRWESVVKRADGMDIEIVHDQANFDGIGIATIEHVTDEEGPIGGLAVLGNGDVAATAQGFDLQENFDHTVADVFVVNEGGMTGSRWDGGSDFANELLGGFIHANKWKPGIVR